ncbi:hypothetical protein BBP00_00004938 [Phytophthora kernoviae]|nr:hypothetical protein BBP00_00004938 [Phytophthora kernoviae]
MSSKSEYCTLPGCERVAPEVAARKILVSDEELRRRVNNVQVTTDFDNALANVSLHGWKWKCDRRAFSMFTKSAISGSGATVPNTEVLAMGTVSGGRALEKVTSLLRSPSENDFNVLMQSVFKRDFIYGSLVHSVAGLEDGTQLAVKTSAFVRSKKFSHKKNEQMCCIEQFRPRKDGFAIVFTSIPLHEVSAGKASGKHVDELCPIRGWLLVEKAPESKASVRVLYYVGLDPNFVNLTQSLGFCSAKTTAARILRLAKGVCLLGEVLHQQRQIDSTSRKNPKNGVRPPTSTTPLWPLRLLHLCQVLLP